MPIFSNTSQAQAFEHWDGKDVEIVSVLCDIEDRTHIDPECMPMFLVRLKDTGEINTADLDEIPESEWGDEMRSVLLGMKACNADSKPTCDKLVVFYEYGQRLAQFKDNL